MWFSVVYTQRDQDRGTKKEKSDWLRDTLTRLSSDVWTIIGELANQNATSTECTCTLQPAHFYSWLLRITHFYPNGTQVGLLSSKPSVMTSLPSVFLSQCLRNHFLANSATNAVEKSKIVLSKILFLFFFFFFFFVRPL